MQRTSLMFGLIAGTVLGLFLPFLYQPISTFYFTLADGLMTSPVGLMAFIISAQLALALIWAISAPPTRVLKFWKEGNAENLPELHARLFPFLTRSPLREPPLAKTIFEWMDDNALDYTSSDQQFRTVLVGKLGSPLSQVAMNRTEECMAAVLFLLWSRLPKKAMAAANRLAVLSSQGSEFPSAEELVTAKHWVMFNKFVKDEQVLHAYASTMLVSMLVRARDMTVFPMTALAWLEQVDPLLWVGLNSAGRPAPLPEALATLGHYAAEVSATHAIEEPAVDAAVTSIRLWLLAHPIKQTTGCL